MFVFGATTVIAVSDGVPAALIVFCVLALTVVRMLPMVRGTTSIVFGLLAFNVLTDRAETAVLLTMVVTVLGSVLLHGVGVPTAARAFSRARANRMTS